MKHSFWRYGVTGALAFAVLAAMLFIDNPLRADSAHQPSAQDHQGHLATSAHSAAVSHDPKGAVPTMPGQAAFGAIQEIVQFLESDPKTDWSKVNLGTLREHLIDMNEVTLKAKSDEKPIPGGLKIAVTGTGRTLDAIRRMITAHARVINGVNGWDVKATPLSNGMLLQVTSKEPKEVLHIRGLSFIGLLASGAHHQPHHLAMAKGEFSH